MGSYLILIDPEVGFIPQLLWTSLDLWLHLRLRDLWRSWPRLTMSHARQSSEWLLGSLYINKLYLVLFSAWSVRVGAFKFFGFPTKTQAGKKGETAEGSENMRAASVMSTWLSQNDTGFTVTTFYKAACILITFEAFVLRCHSACILKQREEMSLKLAILLIPQRWSRYGSELESICLPFRYADNCFFPCTWIIIRGYQLAGNLLADTNFI